MRLFLIIIFISGIITVNECFGQARQEKISAELSICLQNEVSKIDIGKNKDRLFKRSYKFFLQSNFDSALVYTSRYLSTDSKRSELVDFCYYFRGASLMKKNLNSQALEEFDKISSKFPLYPNVRSNEASLQMLEGKYEESLLIFTEVKEIGNLGNYALVRNHIDHNIGVCYMGLGNQDKAEHFLKSSLEGHDIYKDTAFVIRTMANLANLAYLDYRDSEALGYFQQCYDLAYQTENYELRQMTADNMAVFEENRGDFEKSIQFRKEYDQWKDSVNNQDKVWEIAQVEKRHLNQAKQKEIGLLQEKNKLVERENSLKSKQRNVILIGAGVLLLVLVLIIYFYYQKVRSTAIIAEQRESLDKLNGFKNRLFSIVSHDLRSSVHGLRRSTEQLRAEIPSEDSKLKSLVNQQGAIANSTYGMLDNLLNWALLQSDEIYFHPEKISLKRLIPQVVINYQPLLDQKRIALETDVPVDAKINADNDSVKIVLRNVLDNAMKFTPEQGELTISALVKDEGVELRIKDSGPGMSAEQLAIVLEQSSQVSKESGEERSGTGLGVRLCASFMSKNNGRFHIESEEGHGTTVVLRFEKA